MELVVTRREKLSRLLLQLHSPFTVKGTVHIISSDLSFEEGIHQRYPLNLFLINDVRLFLIYLQKLVLLC